VPGLRPRLDSRGGCPYVGRFASELNFLPDPAGVGSDHLLSGFAAEGLLEL
jgi:hypothetical protein